MEYSVHWKTAHDNKSCAWKVSDVSNEIGFEAQHYS